MDNKINFTGTFLVKNPPKAAKKVLKNIVKEHGHIYENFNSTPDSLYVVSFSKDKHLANFILKNNLRFKYSPYIKKVSDLNSSHTENSAKIQNIELPIKDADVLAKMFKIQSKIHKYDYDYNSKGILQALGLKANQLVIRHKNGITYAFTKDGEHVFKSSPVNRYGENYVFFNDSANGNKAKKYMIHGDKLVYEYPQNAKFFEENFTNALIPQFNKTV